MLRNSSSLDEIRLENLTDSEWSMAFLTLAGVQNPVVFRVRGVLHCEKGKIVDIFCREVADRTYATLPCDP